MKKIIAIMLTIILAISCVSCGTAVKPVNSNSYTKKTERNFSEKKKFNNTNEKDNKTGISEQTNCIESIIEEPVDESINNVIEQMPDEVEAKPATITETEVNEIVWANTNANVRSGPGTNYKVVGSLSYADSVNRVAVTNNGWSKIIYGDGIAYVKSTLVQTTEIVKVESTVNNTEATEEPSMTLCVGEAKVIFEETNARRIEAGLEPLEWSDELAAAADIRAVEIIDVFSHTRPDGSDCRTVSSLACAENIIRGPHTNGYEMMEKWMASEGHKTNILYPDLKKIGVAVRCTEMGDTGVQLFGW